MKSQAPFCFLFLLSSAVLTGCGALPRDSDTPSSRFEMLIDSYLSGKLFDEDEENDVTPLSYLRSNADSLRANHAGKVLDRLRAIDTLGLTEDQRIDWLQLEATLKREQRDVSLRRVERNPLQYLTVGSLYWQVTGAAKKDWIPILSTMEQVPYAIDLGRRQLKDPPPLWIQLAVNTEKRYEEFLTGALIQAIQDEAPDSMKPRLTEASRRAASLLGNFRKFLTDTLKPGNSDSWAIGTERYNWLLKEYHFLPYTAAEMIQAGWKVHGETREALKAFARNIDSTRSWKDLVSQMKGEHPRAHTILDAYRSESDRVRKLLVDRDLISIPPAETLTFVPTPPALRETYAWGGYGGIEQRGATMVGRFFVTDIVPGMTAREEEEKLRTQNTGWITVIALHEGYPGHHLQTVYAKNNPRKLRSRLGSTYYGEGWALYCESWMAREGFFLDTWDSLGWLQMRLWRTARVIIDPSIHTGVMSYDQAVQFFVNEVGLERSAAEAEVNRYTTWPTQAPSYIIGWLEIERLKRELQQRFGKQFSEKRFAEEVMKAGSLPLELMNRAVHRAYDANPDVGNN